MSKKEKKLITVALTGNPNSGKTTLFNNLTGANQHIGNWPGVTVEKKEGFRVYKGYELKVVDLPGTYSLTAHSIDEIIARNFLIDDKPDVVVDIIDASNLERNLYLSLQLLEMGFKPIIALNMMDIAYSKDYRIETERLSSLLGVPVVPLVASRNKGIDELLESIIRVIEGKIHEKILNFSYGHEIDNEITKLEEAITADSSPQKYPSRWLALKLLEEDAGIKKKFEELKPDGGEILKVIDKSLERLAKIHRNTVGIAIAEARYGFISGLLKDVIKKPSTEKVSISDQIDKWVLNSWLGIPLFAAVLFGLFQVIFNLSLPLLDWINNGFEYLSNLTSNITPNWLGSMVTDGIIGGVGTVISFVPIISLLYLGLAILEYSGYLTRAAFVMDRLMHRIGLHGRSVVPLVLGFGCSVPAIMAARTIENPRDRLVTIMVTPLISCGARLPIYVLLAGAFFSAYQGLVIFSMYFLGVLLTVILAWFFRKKLVRGESGHFVMELPAYRIPTINSVLIYTWLHTKAFLRRAGTIIFIVVLLFWLLNYSGAIEPIGRAIAPVFSPAGFGQWQAASSLIFGIMAKEVVIGAFGTMFAVGEAELGETITAQLGWTPQVALAFMAMCLLYIPCAATITTIKRETNSWKWTGFVVGYTLILAWIIAVLIFQIGSLFIA
ncbi:MAG: ferrous iron transport protein B [Dehalococcoidia bacterium]|nr:MAG: ferrous iron transport protein B [Dehalococcoidia bacterium]